MNDYKFFVTIINSLNDIIQKNKKNKKIVDLRFQRPFAQHHWLTSSTIMHVQDMWTTTPIGKKFFPPVHFQRVVTESLYDMLTNFHRW